MRKQYTQKQWALTLCFYLCFDITNSQTNISFSFLQKGTPHRFENIYICMAIFIEIIQLLTVFTHNILIIINDKVFFPIRFAVVVVVAHIEVIISTAKYIFEHSIISNAIVQCVFNRLGIFFLYCCCCIDFGKF